MFQAISTYSIVQNMIIFHRNFKGISAGTKYARLSNIGHEYANFNKHFTTTI